MIDGMEVCSVCCPKKKGSHTHYVNRITFTEIHPVGQVQLTKSGLCLSMLSDTLVLVIVIQCTCRCSVPHACGVQLQDCNCTVHGFSSREVVQQNMLRKVA